MPTFVQFGAGNIGRSFLGQIFSRGGYEVVFVDVAPRIIEALNEKHRYRLVIKHPDREEEVVWIENVRAVDGRDIEAVADVLADADIAATSVGQGALPVVLPTIARGLAARRARHGLRPLDIIIAENLHGAAAFFYRGLSEALPQDFPLSDMAGLIETSIGKMVPIMREADLEKDPAWVFAEPYNNLILDARGFRNPIPDVAGLAPKQNIAAYVDRKLYIHNLGHAVTAYLGHRSHPEFEFIYEVLEQEPLRVAVRGAMLESAWALMAAYPEEFTQDVLEAHVDDLLARFANRALGDTVFRVGRDLPRKLSRQDRLVGGMLQCARHGLGFAGIAEAYAAALQFRAGDEQGNPYPADAELLAQYQARGLDFVLREVSGLDASDAVDEQLCSEIRSRVG